MSLDEDKEFVLVIDNSRCVRAVPSSDWATIVLAAEDVRSVAVIEMTRAEARELVVGLLHLLENTER